MRAWRRPVPAVRLILGLLYCVVVLFLAGGLLPAGSRTSEATAELSRITSAARPLR